MTAKGKTISFSQGWAPSWLSTTKLITNIIYTQVTLNELSMVYLNIYSSICIYKCNNNKENNGNQFEREQKGT